MMDEFIYILRVVQHSYFYLVAIKMLFYLNPLLYYLLVFDNFNTLPVY